MINENHNPWKRLSGKIIYDNPWIIVEEDQVVNPAGNHGIYGKVLMKNKAIGVLALDDEDNTWLVGQYRYTLNEYSWEIPTGGSPQGEDYLEGAKRELKEETGLVASRWEKLTRIHTSNSVTDEEGYIFLARGLEQQETSFDDTEELQIKKLPLKEAVLMAARGEITDSMSLAALFKMAVIKGIKI